VIRSSWAVQDAIDLEDARIAMTSLLTPGMRDPATYRDQPGARAGFRPGFYTTDPGRVTVKDGSTLSVAPFQYVMPVRRSINGGAYLITSDEAELIQPLNVQAADGTYSRIDRIIVQQTDEFYGDTTSNVQLLLLVGTPSATPQPPDDPDGGPWVELARYTLTANTTDLTKTSLVDMRGTDRWTVASGGVLPVPDTAARDRLNVGAWPGMTVYNQATQALETYQGSTTWTTGAQLTQLTALMQLATNLTGTAAANVPNKVEGQLYRYQDDLWVWTSGALKRLTWVNGLVDDWQPLSTYVSGYDDDSWNAATRLIGPDIVQMTGLFHNHIAGGKVPSGTVLGTVTAAHRPQQMQYIPCAASPVTASPPHTYITGYVSIAPVSDGATAGQIRFYAGDNNSAWASLQGIIYSLSNPDFGRFHL
jgi:hypothetical protein